MRMSFIAAGSAAIVLAAGAMWQPSRGQRPTGAGADAKTLRSVESFASVADTQARSIALFEEAGKVLQHPRCVNCHPVGDRPRQSDTRHLHQPLVVRGKDGHGAPGMALSLIHI